MAPKLHIISLFSLCTAMLQEKQLIICAGHSCKYMHCICFQNIIFWIFFIKMKEKENLCEGHGQGSMYIMQW